eukprot:5800502-Pleurochrysis_carterae.AAC.1
MRRAWQLASPSTLISRSRYLLQSLAFMIAANGCDDYGRASNECSVWKGNIVMTTKGQLLPEHTTTPWGQRKRALWITVPLCAS